MVRVSGGAAHAAGRAMTPQGKGLPSAHRSTTVATLVHPTTGDELDRAVLLRFDAPHSFTGEDVLELHVHGGHAVIASVLDALSSCPGLRPAEAGEFTRRAFLNHKMDLGQVGMERGGKKSWGRGKPHTHGML